MVLVFLPGVHNKKYMYTVTGYIYVCMYYVCTHILYVLIHVHKHMSMGKLMCFTKFHQGTVTISDAALHFFNPIFKTLFVTYQRDQFEIHYSM